MPKDQILMGVVMALICATGLCKDRWLLANTRKGQWLARKLGELKAIWVLRIFLATGVGFGVLLAAGIINPIQW